jgi:CheY-like chemotaxis protein
VTALIVHDDAQEAQLVAQALEAAGAEVHRELSALTALAAIRELQPDVLLSKVDLPVVDGWTLIRQVRVWSRHQGCGIPAIALGSTRSGDDLNRSLREGFQRHLMSPFSSRQIVVAVAEVLGRAS